MSGHVVYCSLTIHHYRHHVSSTIFSYGQLKDHTGSIPTILNDDVVVVSIAKKENTTNETVSVHGVGHFVRVCVGVY